MGLDRKTGGIGKLAFSLHSAFTEWEFHGTRCAPDSQ